MPDEDPDRFSFENTKKELDRIVAERQARQADEKSGNPSWVIVLIALIFLGLGLGLLVPTPPFICDKPVSAVVVRKQISTVIHSGRSGSTTCYRPLLLVRYNVGDRNFGSYCTVSNANFVEQLFDADDAATPEEAQQKLSPYVEGDHLSIFYSSDIPTFVSLTPGIHVKGGGRMPMVMIGIVFLILWLLTLCGFGSKSS